MTTTVRFREKTKPISLIRKILFALAAIGLILFCQIFLSTAGHARTPADDEMMNHMQEAQATGDCKSKGLSYYNFEHCRYHEYFYSKLKKWNTKNQSFSDSCCSGKECRVTAPLRTVTPEFKGGGFTHMVMIEGDWYPINLTEKQTGFTPDQFAEVRRSPLFQEFVQLTHVCAGWWDAPSEEVRLNPKLFRKFLIDKIRFIYCVMDGGDKA